MAPLCPATTRSRLEDFQLFIAGEKDQFSVNASNTNTGDRACEGDVGDGGVAPAALMARTSGGHFLSTEKAIVMT